MRTPSSSSPIRRERLPREIWILVAAATIIALGFGIVAPVLPHFAKSFNVSITLANTVISIFAATRLLGAPLAGRMIDRFGERQIYLVGIAIVAASTFASAFAQSYLQLLIFRGAGGIGSVMFSIAAMSLIIRNAPISARGRASAAYGGGFTVGNIAGPAIGGALAGYGLRMPFIIYGISLVIALIVVGLTFPKESKEQVAEEVAEHTPAPDAPSRVEVLPLREALRTRAYRAILVTSFSNAWVNWGVRVALVPLFVDSLPGAQDWHSGLILTIFAIGSVAVLGFAGPWADAGSRRRVVVTGLMISGALTLALGHMHGIWLLGAVCFVAGAGAGFIMPGMQGALADVVGTKNGAQVVALFQQAGDFGQVIGPILIGVIADNFGFDWGFGVSGAILLLACLPWRGVRTSKPRLSTGE